jgi:gliding motility-associated-like protein
MSLGFGWVGGVGNVPATSLAFKVDGPNSSTGPSNVSCGYALPGGFVLGTWYHAAGVMDYTNHLAKLYLNGLLVDTKTINSAPFSRVILGELSWDVALAPGYPGPPLGGSMDEVRIWKRVRTDNEIASSYNQCLTGTETDLVLYYHCNQTAGSLALDATPNGNDGILANAANWSVQQPTLQNFCSSCIDICDNKVSAKQDTVICQGATANLNASTGFDFYNWTPSNSLSDSTISNPTANPLNSTTYVVTAAKLDANLVVNGDFSSGNSGFTSNYTYCNTNNCLTPFIKDGYSIGPNPNFYHVAYQGVDHTTGSGNLMVVNGSNSGYNVWSQTINVSPSQNYSFSLWACSVFSVNTAQLEFFINNVSIGTMNANNNTKIWDEFSYIWNSGASSSAVISARSVINIPGYSQNGNDFGLDDISFRKVCFSSDTVKVTVRSKNVPNLNIGNDTTMFANSVLLINAGSGYVNYTWNDGSTGHTYTVYEPGKYWVTVKDSCGGLHTDTINVRLLPYPFLDLGADKRICNGDSILLNFVPTGLFSTYQWSPALFLNCDHCANPYADPTASTEYYLTASTAQGCTVSDSIFVTVGQNLFSSIKLDLLYPICGQENGEIRINNLDNNFAPYQFNFNQTGYTSSADYSHLGSGNYNIQIKDYDGCILDTIAVLDGNQEETISVPNCFSPNDDGVNDKWYISGTCIQSIECRIFNRWGEMMKSFNRLNDEWDGKYKEYQVPDGVYFYTLEINYYSGAVKTQGFISLFR